MCGGGRANQAAAQSGADNQRLVTDISTMSTDATSTAQTETQRLLGEQRAAFDAQNALQETRYNQLVQDTALQNRTMMEGFKTAIGGITAQAGSQAEAQSTALQQMMNSMKEAQMSASADLEAQRRNTGQKAKKANIGELMRQNKAKMAKGNSSTLLTGVGGVAAADLTLGKPALLGA
jgi:predicted ATPase